METIGIQHHDCRLIGTHPSSDDLQFLTDCDLILLAGGDPLRGWNAFTSQQEGIVLVHILRNCYEKGVVFIGISAGAILLCEKAYSEDDETKFKEATKKVSV